MKSPTSAANNYRRLRRLASLCSHASRQDAGVDAQNQLAAILSRSASGEFQSYSDLLLLTLVDNSLEFDVGRIESLAQALLSGEVNEAELGEIKQLGELLYGETAHALSRLRSG